MADYNSTSQSRQVIADEVNSMVIDSNLQLLANNRQNENSPNNYSEQVLHLSAN